MNNESVQNAVDYLRQASTIRVRCHQMLRLGRKNQLQHFAINDAALNDAAEIVAKVTRQYYPDLKVPYHSRWRHFEAGGIDRSAAIRGISDRLERGRRMTELAITSVLLDAGAGEKWRFLDPKSGKQFYRSEGLAIASLHMYENGIFSSRSNQSLLVDARGIDQIAKPDFMNAFQLSESNPLVGLDGRIDLVKRLGNALSENPAYFGKEAQLGSFFDHLLSLSKNGAITGSQILMSVLRAFGEIWPGRINLGGINLGDVWHHSAIQTDDLTSGLVPFHKLSQWLTYSLLEPLELAGIRVTEVDGLTGLPEYRNGGLFIDAGVLIPKDPEIVRQSFKPDAEIIVEWRALTVALLDELAPMMRTKLGVDAETFPLAKVLQGGTWAAGRKLANDKRPGGLPPISIISDGTVF